MEIHGAAVSHILIFPHALVNSLSKKGDIFILEEQNQKIVLLRGQLHDFTALGDHPGLGVHHHVVHDDPALGLVVAAQHSLHPGQELGDLEGLDDIVVCAQAQTLDPVLDGTPRRDKDDGNLQGG